MAPSTKSPSNSIAALGLPPKTWSTQLGYVVEAAPAKPPTMLLGSSKILPRVVNAVVRLGSVQGMRCCARRSYMSWPAVRRYTFSNQSVRVHPEAPHTETPLHELMTGLSSSRQGMLTPPHKPAILHTQ